MKNRKFDKIEEHFIGNALNVAINNAEKNNYKLTIRHYLKKIFGNDTNYNVENIIKEAQERASKIFEE